MKPIPYPIKLLASILILSILISSCTSKTLLQTSPNFASVYVDGQKVGSTPYIYSDTKIVSASTMIMFRKDGYMDLYINLIRNEQLDVGNLVWGIFFLWPLLWLNKYDPVHSFELKKIEGGAQTIPEEDTEQYLVGEDERITITVDSVRRTNSLPESLKRDINEIEEFGSGTTISTYLNEGNDYVLIYITVVEKRDLNVSLSDYFLPGISIKDEFGKLHVVMLDRGTYYVKYPGYNFLWNPNTPLSKEKISETEFLLFQFPKDKTPLQMRFYYYYKPDPPYRGQKKWAQIDIDLVLRDEY